MNRAVLSVVACAVLLGLVIVSSAGSTQAQQPAKKPLKPAEAVLRNWNDIGDKLIDMAEDWPAEKYNYRPNEKVRTFAQQLLHVAGSNYSIIDEVTGKKMGNEETDPSTEVFKSKAQVVEFLKKSIKDGAATIEELGDAGIEKRIGPWISYTEHMGEHYGQLVVYYRNNGMVPPDSRPKK